MREPRIKVPAELGSAVYHCISRTVNGEWLLDDVAKEVFRRQLRQVAEYCGVDIITYVILSNHFHLLVRVPQRTDIADPELLRRYSVLYPHPTAYQLARLDIVRADLKRNGPEAAAWRRRQLALMGDLSQFVKLLKQRFSIWFNRAHGRFGTLWAERFKSVLVEPHPQLIEAVAAYIDLNAVRAGLIKDPKDYRFCGYAEAVAGNAAAQSGISIAARGTSWTEVHAQYREMLFGIGAAPRGNAASTDLDAAQRVSQMQGHLPKSILLRCRLRYLTEGAVLGTRAFVGIQLAALRKKTRLFAGTPPYTIPGSGTQDDLTTLRRLRLRRTSIPA